MSENRLVVFVRRFLPVAEQYSGDAFFVLQDGRRVATPLLLVLVVVELTDVVRSLLSRAPGPASREACGAQGKVLTPAPPAAQMFAVDSIPAVFGVTQARVLA